MWNGGKTAATFFTKLFEKEKDLAEEPEVPTYQRKRSQSLFAPNVSSLMSGDHVGGIGSKVDCVQSSVKDALFNISTNPFLAIPSMPELISKFSLVDGDQDQSTEADNPPEDADEGGDDDDADLCQSLDRLATRRVTDFSQANSDLQRFLASRKTPNANEKEYKMTETFSRKDVIFHKKIYGSVEALDCETHQINKRFRVEACSKSQSDTVPSLPVLENPENQTKWYYKYFLGKLHQNFIGQDTDKNVFLLSVLQEKSYGKSQFRAVLWTKNGPKRLQFRSEGKSVTIKQLLSNYGYLDKVEKIPREVVSPNIQKDILWLEKQEGSMNFKFGVIFAKPGQIMDDELLSNESGSQRFHHFLSLLGEKIRLAGWRAYRGGLDVRADMTGEESIYTRQQEHEIMFHVSTLLPFCPEDKQQVERKRHIGNDIVNIIFVDGNREDMAKFKPAFIKSQMTHVYAVVCYEEESSRYFLTVYSEESVPLFGPGPVPSNGFSDHHAFRTFLLVKCINGEKATYNTSVFSSKRERTFQILLEDSYSQYSKEPLSKPSAVISESSESSRLNSYRRREDSRKDIFVKVGQSLKLENTISGELGVLTSQTGLQRSHQGIGWEPLCVVPSLQFEVLAGDSWAGVGFLVTAREGAWLLRTEKVGKEPGGVFVYRLAQLEEATTAPGREEMKEHVLEGSRGCLLYSLGDREHSSLTLAVGLARKIIVYKWKHAEEWMTFTDDTVQGFELLTEIHCVEAPQVLTLLERQEERMVLIGNKKGFDFVTGSSQDETPVISLKSGEVPTMCQELRDEERLGLLLSHTCTTLYLHQEDQQGGWKTDRQINWNCHPLTIVPAGPYILALSADTLEIRSNVNGTLLQTLNLPKLQFLSAKEDLYFTTTKQGYNIRKNSEMEPMSKFCDPTSQCHLYKIPWNLLLGVSGSG